MQESVLSTETKDRIKDLHRTLEGKRADIARFTAADGPIKVDGSNVSVSPEDVASLRKLVGEAEEIKSLIATLESADGIGTFLDAAPGSGDGGVAGQEAAAELQRKSLEEAARPAARRSVRCSPRASSSRSTRRTVAPRPA
jgi:hypothetical protein